MSAALRLDLTWRGGMSGNNAGRHFVRAASRTMGRCSYGHTLRTGSPAIAGPRFIGFTSHHNAGPAIFSSGVRSLTVRVFISV